MKNKLLLLLAASTFGLSGGAAVAGQPLMLSDAQMDRVVAAGALGSATSLAEALGNLNAQTVTLSLGSVDVLQGSAVAIGLSTASASSLSAPAVASSRSAAIARAP
jgi:hypothetical protein